MHYRDGVLTTLSRTYSAISFPIGRPYYAVIKRTPRCCNVMKNRPFFIEQNSGKIRAKRKGLITEITHNISRYFVWKTAIQNCTWFGLLSNTHHELHNDPHRT